MHLHYDLLNIVLILLNQRLLSRTPGYWMVSQKTTKEIKVEKATIMFPQK